MITSVIYFLIILIAIVMVHEFGHFLFAKLFGVYVTEFSIGFGPKLFSIKGKETEYIFKPILLGGYVRMAGDTPESRDIPSERDKGIPRERLLYSQKAWKRFLIIFAGPLFSILAGYVMMIFISITWGFPQTMIDWVVPGSPAAEAGLKPRDVIKAINGHVILSPTEVSGFVKGNDRIEVTYLRGGKVHKVSLVTREIGPQYFLAVSKKVESANEISTKALQKNGILSFSSGATALIYGVQKIPRGKEMGIYMTLFSNKVASVDPKTGLKKGDVILSIDGMKCSSSFDFQNALFVANVAKGSGEFLITDGKKIIFREPFHSNGKVEMIVKRGKALKKITLSEDEFKILINSLATYPAYKNWYPGLKDAVVYGIIRTNRIFTKMIVFLANIFKSKNVINQFVGPVGLVKMVGQASNEGMQTLLTLIAFITLNLGLVNLLPLPALDGGHLVFALVEMITGKRVNPEVEGYIHTIGFFLLMAFFVYITYLDIIRFGG